MKTGHARSFCRALLIVSSRREGADARDDKVAGDQLEALVGGVEIGAAQREQDFAGGGLVIKPVAELAARGLAAGDKARLEEIRLDVVDREPERERRRHVGNRTLRV